MSAGQNQTLTLIFTPSDATDYSTITATTSLNVLQATPTISWPNPADITYGTALGPAQLDATASVPGTFTYTPAAGTILNAGPGQTLSVTFTSTDATDYNMVSAQTLINVLKATPTVGVTDAGGTYSTDPYPATDATVTGVGTDGTIANFGDPTLRSRQEIT
jgi:hypothetical protein